MLVLDASAAVEVLLGASRAAPVLRTRLARAGETVHVPHLFDIEVLAAVRRHGLRGSIAMSRVERAAAALGDLRAFRYSHAPLRARIWGLRHNLSPYDAAYVALAEALRSPLITVDAALGAAPGVDARIEVFP